MTGSIVRLTSTRPASFLLGFMALASLGGSAQASPSSIATHGQPGGLSVLSGGGALFPGEARNVTGEASGVPALYDWSALDSMPVPSYDLPPDLLQVGTGVSASSGLGNLCGQRITLGHGLPKDIANIFDDSCPINSLCGRRADHAQGRPVHIASSMFHPPRATARLSLPPPYGDPPVLAFLA